MPRYLLAPIPMQVHPTTLEGFHYTQTWRKGLPSPFKGTLLTMTYLLDMQDFFVQDLCVLLGVLGKPSRFAPTMMVVPWLCTYSRTQVNH